MTKDHINNCREHLITITNGLISMAKKLQRQDYTANQLLRECYNLVDADIKSQDDWHKEGREIRRGQHAYLFWDKDYIDLDKRNVLFLYSKEQTISLTNKHAAYEEKD